MKSLFIHCLPVAYRTQVKLFCSHKAQRQTLLTDNLHVHSSACSLLLVLCTQLCGGHSYGYTSPNTYVGYLLCINVFLFCVLKHLSLYATTKTKQGYLQKQTLGSL